MYNRSFIKWVGGKSRSLSQIMDKFPREFDTYYEPFLGSGVVYFNVLPDKATLNDKEHNLVSAFRDVKRYPEQVCEQLKGLDNKEGVYYDVRHAFNHTDTGTPGEKTAQFIYMNKCGYNGLYRVNKSGAMNVAFGRRSGQPHQDFTVVRECSKALQKAQIMNTDYLEILDLARRGDFVYLDPPYHKETSTSFTGYNAVEFTEKDHRQLAEECRDITDRGVLFAMSNSSTDLILDLYKNFYIYPVYTSRTVAVTTGGRGTATELLITNYGGGTI